jgi:hypothetical protein
LGYYFGASGGKSGEISRRQMRAKKLKESEKETKRPQKHAIIRPPRETVV